MCTLQDQLCTTFKDRFVGDVSLALAWCSAVLGAGEALEQAMGSPHPKSQPTVWNFRLCKSKALHPSFRQVMGLSSAGQAM